MAKAQEFEDKIILVMSKEEAENLQYLTGWHTGGSDFYDMYQALHEVFPEARGPSPYNNAHVIRKI